MATYSSNLRAQPDMALRPHTGNGPGTWVLEFSDPDFREFISLGCLDTTSLQRLAHIVADALGGRAGDLVSKAPRASRGS